MALTALGVTETPSSRRGPAAVSRSSSDSCDGITASFVRTTERSRYLRRETVKPVLPSTFTLNRKFEDVSVQEKLPSNFGNWVHVLEVSERRRTVASTDSRRA
jgi:hypothetical protein